MRLCNHHKLNTNGTERNGAEQKKRLISKQTIGAHETLFNHKLNTSGTERKRTNGTERNGTAKQLISLQ